MKAEDWKKCVLEAVADVADRSFQERAWFGGSEEISSPDEVYYTLIEDFVFDEFIVSPEVGLTSEQRALAQELRDKMARYWDMAEDFLDPRKVFDDPKWEEVRKTASRFLKSFD